MRISRRHLLHAAAATLFVPDPRRGRRWARADESSLGPLIITLEAAGAWDTTFLIDPKVDSGFTPWTSDDIRTALGTQIQYAPKLLADGTRSVYRVGALADDFFVKHGSRLLVINGVDNATVSHDIGPRVAFTGSNREGIPTFSGLVAGIRGPALPLSLMTTGGFVNTEGLVPVTRAGKIDVLLGLARSNLQNAATASGTPMHDDSVLALVRERVVLRDARRQTAARIPRETVGIVRVQASRLPEVTSQFDALAEALEASSAVQSTNPIIPKAAACLAAMSAGACAVAHIATDASFDTHDQHDTDHPPAMQELLEILDFILDSANADPVISSRGLVVVVGSDFGRTRYNSDAGKDHWPVTSMMVATAGAASVLVDGGRTVGETVLSAGGSPANGVVARRVKEQDGDVISTQDDDPDGIVLTAGHVHLALRHMLGISDDAISTRFPLTAVVPQTPLPLLKPA